MNCLVRFGNCFLRVALMYQPSCLQPCCQGKPGNLQKKLLSKPRKQFILSLGTYLTRGVLLSQSTAPVGSVSSSPSHRHSRHSSASWDQSNMIENLKNIGSKCKHAIILTKVANTTFILHKTIVGHKVAKKT